LCPQRKKKSVMIVDDDRGRRQKLYAVLRLTGFDLFSATSGTEAMSKLPREKPQLIVVNMFSVAVSGLDFLKELRTYGMGQKITVIGMVAEDNGESKRVTSAGADDLLDENFAPYRLVELVSKHMGIDKIEIRQDQFDKRREIVEELAESYRERRRKAKKGGASPAVQLFLPDGKDLGTLLLTDDAGKHRRA